MFKGRAVAGAAQRRRSKSVARKAKKGPKYNIPTPVGGKKRTPAKRKPKKELTYNKPTPVGGKGRTPAKRKPKKAGRYYKA